MNRRTFFTSLASLGVAPHSHARLANPQYTLDELSPPQYFLTKGTRPFSGNAVEVYERWHIPAPTERPIRGLAAWLPEPGTPYWPPSALAHRRP